MADTTKKTEVAHKMARFISRDGTTSKFGSKHPTLDHLLYKPFKGSHRGYVYRIPIVGKKIFEKDVTKASKKYQDEQNKTGIFNGKGERDKDQELGKMKHDIQTKGVYIK
jgi:hypothetical protein